LEGFCRILVSLYAPSAFYNRAYRSLLRWKARKAQKPPEIPLLSKVGIIARSVVHQGILSSYRKAYWKFLVQLVMRCASNPPKFSLGFGILLSGHHFIPYASRLVLQLESELDRLRIEKATTAIS
jgi:hypothetical protein